MDAALAVVAALAALLLLLAVPVGVSFRLRGLEAPAAQVGIRWLFGLVRFRLRVPRGARRGREERRAAREARRRARPRARGGRGGALAVLGQAAFRRRALRLARDVVRAAHPRRLGLHLRIGLGDPADTGRLWALVAPALAAASPLRGADVRVEPDFVDPVLEIEVRGRLLVIPLQLVSLFLAFALSPSSIRAWRALRAHRG